MKDLQKLLDRREHESSELEYYSGFNPRAVVRTICAFANDIENNGGGIIVIGVGDDDGMPQFPLRGVKPGESDKIKRKLSEYSRTIEPQYEPAVESVKCFDSSDNTEKELVVISVPTGYDRPYRAPENVYSGKSRKRTYVRRCSSTVMARRADEAVLHTYPPVPFDERICFSAGVDDLSPDRIREFLLESGSSLYRDTEAMDFLSIAREMGIMSETGDGEKPLNAGILMFSVSPQKYFPYARIEVVNTSDSDGKDTTADVFTGTIREQLRGTLEWVRNNIIEEKVIGEEENRVFNYPYEAIEEVLTNAVYHRSYQVQKPITVRIADDGFTITSPGGFDRSISDEAIKSYNLRGRVYRNRRIGDFLKEIHITRGRGTGFPRVLAALGRNGSGKPGIVMNDERDFVSVRIPLHPYFVSSREK